MITLREQIEEISTSFPGSFLEGSEKLIIPMFPNVKIILNLKNYPKKPKIKMPKPLQPAMGAYEIYLPDFQHWDKKKPPNLAPLMQAFKQTTEILAGTMIYLSDKIIHDLAYLAKNAYPKEMFCLLRLKNGVIDEYIMAPGMEATNAAAVFFPKRLGADKTLVATAHSHPSGNFHPSHADLMIFRKYPLNIIIAKPYSIQYMGVYDMRGESLPYKITIPII